MREVDLVIKLIEDHKPEKASAYLVSLFSSHLKRFKREQMRSELMRSPVDTHIVVTLPAFHL